MSYDDITQRTGRAYDITPADNHAAVCAVLRWAKRTGADVAAVGELCETLGLDLAAAVAETGSQRPCTESTQATTPGSGSQAARLLHSGFLA